MNTLFEKFKDYELTKEQASKVGGGHDYCAILGRCKANASHAAWSSDNGLDEDDLHSRMDLEYNLILSCYENFLNPCLLQNH